MSIKWFSEYQEEIPKYYLTAKELEVVGIACKNFFMKQLCEGYYRPGKSILNIFEHSELFKGLQKGLKVTVYIVNPYCEYANIRAIEEDNKECRGDILRVIHLVQAFHRELCNKKNDQSWKIGGQIEVWMLTSNPYVSYTRIKRENGSDIFVVGLLLCKAKGTSLPKLFFDCAGPDGGLISVFHKHLGALSGNSELLFRWPCNNAVAEVSEFIPPKKIVSGVDVFICYNRKNLEDVRLLKEGLEESGIVPWMDEEDIYGGEDWLKKIRGILSVVKCVAVIVGSAGISHWQVVEFTTFKLQVGDIAGSIIPVILPDAWSCSAAEGGFEKTKLKDLLRATHWVELQDYGKGGYTKLSEAIRNR